jgi:hypothetical protein
MNETFGITYEIKNPVPWQPNKTVRVKDTGFTTMHDASSRAGKEIQKPFIQSVCSYQRTGKNAGAIGVYLAKDSQGHVVKREYNPSRS